MTVFEGMVAAEEDIESTKFIFDFFRMHVNTTQYLVASIEATDDDDAWRQLLALPEVKEDMTIYNGRIYWNDMDVISCIKRITTSSLNTFEMLMAGFRDSETHTSPNNPHRKIKIEPTYSGMEKDVLNFLSKILSGFIWECEKGISFISHHPEIAEIRKLKEEIDDYIVLGRTNRDLFLHKRATYGDISARVIHKFALILPSLWD